MAPLVRHRSFAVFLVAFGAWGSLGVACSSTKVSGVSGSTTGGGSTSTQSNSTGGSNTGGSSTGGSSTGGGASCTTSAPDASSCPTECDYPNACGVKTTGPDGCCKIEVLPDGASCGGANVCRQGMCVACAPCADGGPCVDHASDRMNCGACGNVCAPDQVCGGGICGCPGISPQACGGACKDLASDPKNCGACGTACASGESCSGGKCFVVVASGLDYPAAVRVDGAEVYWLSESSVAKAPIAGGAVTVLAAGLPRPIGMDLDAANLYFTDIKGNVKKVPRAGGAVTTLAACQSPYDAPVADAQSVYWVNGDGATLVKVPLGGGPITKLASAASSPFAVRAGTAYWLGGSDTLGDYAIMKVSVAGGTPSKVVGTTDYRALTLTTDATRVYWLSSGGSVSAAPLAGGPIVALASGVPWSAAMATDGANVYLAASKSVVKVPVAGGVLTTVATLAGNQLAEGVAVDTTSVYWTNAGTGSLDGAVVKAPK